jgi:hypothetical protein
MEEYGTVTDRTSVCEWKESAVVTRCTSFCFVEIQSFVTNSAEYCNEVMEMEMEMENRMFEDDSKCCKKLIVRLEWRSDKS